MMSARACSIVVLAACWIGCVAEPLDEPPDESEVSSAVGCLGFGCNANTPIVFGNAASEMHRTLPNTDGLRIAGFKSATGASYQLDVRQARLVGLNGAGQIALDTSNIKDAVIKLVDDSGESWEIVVAEVSGMAYWAPPAGSVITYRLRVRAPPNSGYQDHDLCSSPPAPGSWPGNMYHAILFEGDRYRPVEKIVSAIGPATAGWFNIACAGSVPAKLHLARHTESSANPAKWPSQAQRQAMLRAYAAAVCWGKDSYTAKGELLNIFDRNDVMTGQIDFNKIEGLWDATHAICLGEAPVGEQRLVHANSMLQADANQLLQQMKLDCPGIPSCSTIPNLATTWKQIGMVLTTNP